MAKDALVQDGRQGTRDSVQLFGPLSTNGAPGDRGHPGGVATPNTQTARQNPAVPD